MNGGTRCKVLITLRNKHGLHARPATLWVQTANGFASSLRVGRPDEEKVDGKSIMGIMMLAAEHGTVLELESEGPDCEAQVRAITELVEARFGED
jgi:phosphocarrier protein